MKIFLAGPIDWWWNENWETPAHIAYKHWREEINQLLVEAGHLVYRPHEAFKGAWDEAAQAVNNAALKMCDVVIYLTPPHVPAYGTSAECELARIMGKQVLWAPPGDPSQIGDYLHPLDDPYGKVARKSYTKQTKDEALAEHSNHKADLWFRADGNISCERCCVWVWTP